jgi:hypothetical protein
MTTGKHLIGAWAVAGGPRKTSQAPSWFLKDAARDGADRFQLRPSPTPSWTAVSQNVSTGLPGIDGFESRRTIHETL